MKSPNLIGERFGKLTVLRKSEVVRARKAVWWVCSCECGNETEATTSYLRSGETKSCGCLKSEKCADRNRSHGLCLTPEYNSWCAMKMRCYNQNSDRYRHYGGRGITVCDEWRDDFPRFLKDMGPRPTDAHSIDRIDVNGNYEPSNCRWATDTMQMRNTTRNRFIEFQGQIRTLSEWEEVLGFTSGVIGNRIDQCGWSIERALTTPKMEGQGRPGGLFQPKAD